MVQTKEFKEIVKKSKLILKKNDVVKAGIFGSFAKGKAKKTSDIDFLVQFKAGKGLFDLVRLKYQLEDKLNKKVDIVTYRSVHPLLKKEIMSEEIKIL
ncbi:nucleotidyltransferase family protein [archaeon]|jgi:uncharacterized protein|nr:nucleotidyltransferase family protein [archaeon]MBT4417081.1 nucleotidyltransferase family protein [archaeon]